MTTLDADIPCTACGGSLRGADLHRVCPNCGRLVEASLELGVINEADLTVGTDVSCVHCGYNVRTVSISSRCPECGQAVVDSLRPSELRYAPLDWLLRLRSAATMLLLAHAGPPLIMIGMIQWPGLTLAGMLFPVTALGMLALLDLGLIAVNEPKPEDQTTVMRKRMQVTVTCLTLASFLILWFSVIAMWETPFILSMALMCAAGIGSLRTIARLARQGRNAQLLRAATGAAVLLTGWLVGFVAYSGLFMLEQVYQLPAGTLAAVPFQGWSPRPQILILVLALLTYFHGLVTALRCRLMLSKVIREQTVLG